MKRVFLGMMILGAGLLMALPVFAHCGHCDMDKAQDCAHKTDKMCDKAGHKATQNFVPGNRK